MKRLIAVPLALIALASCAKTAPPPETPEAAAITPPAPPPFEPRSFLPAETFALARLDVPRILASPYFGWYESFATTSLSPEETEQAEVFLALARGVSELHVAFVPGTRSPDLGAVLFRSTLGADQLREHIVRFTEEDDIVAMTLGGREAFGDDQGAFVHLADDWWVGGPRESLEATLASPALPGALADAGWSQAEDRVALPAPMVDVLLLGGNEGVRQAMRGSPLDPEDVEQVVAAAAEMDATDGVQVSAALLTSDPALAQRVAADLQAQLAEARSQAPPFVPIEPLLAGVTVAAAGGDVVVDVNISDATVRAFYAVVSGFVGMFQNGAPGAPPPPPPTSP